MTPELTMLTWTLILALAQILATALLRTQETGLKYNASARDAPAPPPRPITARMMRAQTNLFETLPLFIAAILIAHVAGRDGAQSYSGAMLYFWGRVVYVPLYAFGVPYLRSVAWIVSLVGLIRVIEAVMQ